MATISINQFCGGLRGLARGGARGEGAEKHSVYWGFARIAGIAAEYRKVVDWFEGLARFFGTPKTLPLMGLCGTPLPLFYGGINQYNGQIVQYKAVCFSRQPNNTTKRRNVQEPTNRQVSSPAGRRVHLARAAPGRGACQAASVGRECRGRHHCQRKHSPYHHR